MIFLWYFLFQTSFYFLSSSYQKKVSAVGNFLPQNVSGWANRIGRLLSVNSRIYNYLVVVELSLTVPLLVKRALSKNSLLVKRAVSYLEYQITSKPWAWKPLLLDEFTSVGQKGICSSYPRPLLAKLITAGCQAGAVTSMDHLRKFRVLPAVFL